MITEINCLTALVDGVTSISDVVTAANFLSTLSQKPGSYDYNITQHKMDFYGTRSKTSKATSWITVMKCWKNVSYSNQYN